MIERLKKSLRTVPDFPKPGVLFYDITTMLKDPESLTLAIDALYETYKDKGITKVVGIESRGFILGAALAVKLGVGFIPIRKAGKLPLAVYSERYNLEYGSAVMEIHQDAISPDDVVLIHDDLLATGGTMLAARHLVSKFNPKKIYLNCIIELKEFDGRSRFPDDYNLLTLLPF